MSQKTRVVYKLNLKRLAMQLAIIDVSEISRDERMLVLVGLWSAFDDAFQQVAGYSAGESDGDLYSYGFAIEVDHPEKLPAHYPSMHQWLTRE